MHLSDFAFDLPAELIALRPAAPRTAARMLYARGRTIDDRAVTDLVDILRRGDRLVLNDTKVIPARLSGTRRRFDGQRDTTARIDVTLLSPDAENRWHALLKPLKKIRPGETIKFSDDFSAHLVSKANGTGLLEFNRSGDDFELALAREGAMPLPPYIAAQRPVDARDNHDYQTVFAENTGAVAAPTASLHFDQQLLTQLENKGVAVSKVTLHVGAGTFLPVKTDNIKDHKMHAERGVVSRAAADQINATRARGGRIFPVGTTALRLLETAADSDGVLHPWAGETDIFITPGYRFRICDGLMTNFHLPESTLMMLVSALMGVDEIKKIYRHAIDRRYRFFSYGDSSFLLPLDKKTT